MLSHDFLGVMECAHFFLPTTVASRHLARCTVTVAFPSIHIAFYCSVQQNCHALFTVAVHFWSINMFFLNPEFFLGHFVCRNVKCTK
jgi:hypothetical protein